jgi:uncharacterized protein YutE (UPF0331/DUF86 family)
MRIASILSRIERHRKKAEELSKMDLSNYLVFNSLAMECFQAVNSAIELAETIVSEKNLGFPSSYKETFEFLYKEKMISKNTFECIKKLIFLRNLIAHEYYTISEEELKEMAKLLSCLDEFIEIGKNLQKPKNF